MGVNISCSDVGFDLFCLSLGRVDWSGAIIFLIISIVSVLSYFFSESVVGFFWGA